MRNGFTLIELLGVIAILAILSLIAVPIIDVTLNKGKTNLETTQEKQIIKGAKDFFAENLGCLPNNSTPCTLTVNNKCSSTYTCSGNSCNIWVTCLQNEGYLPANLKNPKTDKPYTDTKVTVTVDDKGKVSYKVI